MIQRIQTIWLLLASIAAFLTMQFPFYKGVPITDSASQAIALTAMDKIYIVTATVVCAMASLIAIFLFKDRRLQMRITLANILLSLILIALYFVDIKNNYAALDLLPITSVFVFVIPVFLFLAFRGIFKDNRLVKSVDRLR